MVLDNPFDRELRTSNSTGLLDSLCVHYDGKGDRGEQAASWLDRAYFAEPAPDHQAGDTQPLDWQLRRIYSARPCCWPSSMPSCAC